MPASDAPDFLVARYLKSNGFDKTLAAFLEETGIEEDQINKQGKFTLEDLLEEKRIYDLSLKIETILAIEKKDEEFLVPYPNRPHELGPSSSQTFQPANYLFASIFHFAPPYNRRLILATSSSGNVYLYDPLGSATVKYPLVKTFTKLHTTPILSCCLLAGSFLLTGSVDGSLAIHDVLTERVLWRSFDSHKRFVVKIEVSGDGKWFASASYDKSVRIYRINKLPEAVNYEGGNDSEENRVDVTLVSTLEVSTTPEAICFVPFQEGRFRADVPDGDDATETNASTAANTSTNTSTNTPLTSPPITDAAHDERQILITSRRDSTTLTYYLLTPPTSITPSTLTYLTTFSLTPTHIHSSISFTPMSLALHPKTPTLLAVVTDTIPTMKFLLIETYTGKILVECFTGATQSPYSTAVVAWRPDGAGVWVNSDDGVVRGLEARSGKVVAVLNEGHAGKVRTLAAGEVMDLEGGKRELLVTGGFDQKLVVWEVGGGGGGCGDNGTGDDGNGGDGGDGAVDAA